MPHLVADGRRLEYRWIAPQAAGAPPLVLLHEGLGSADLWGDFPDRLAERTGWGTLIYSRYGFGGSDRLAEPRDAGYLDREALVALPALLAELGLASPVLVGHSDGATIALIHAADGRWNVRGLVLEAPHVFVEQVTLRGVVRARAAFTDGTLRERLRPWHADVDATFRGWADVWLQPEFRDWNIEGRLTGVRCPTLLIQGENDQYGTRKQLTAIERGISGPVTTVVLPDCGHAPHAERGDEVLDRMARFLSESIGGAEP
ncbi:MAG TPA: alpha/beta hydrolase [Gemmatimonadales bacterium]|nr:alpha/beta hydrolase [Gemmatimonadales bacterium]